MMWLLLKDGIKMSIVCPDPKNLPLWITKISLHKDIYPNNPLKDLTKWFDNPNNNLNKRWSMEKVPKDQELFYMLGGK